MSGTRPFTIAAPHPDIEHGRRRQPLEYLATPPDAGVTRETGLILLIDGYGSTPDTPYNQVLRRYLACRYNCVVAGVYYFGCRLKSESHVRCRPDTDFFLRLHEHHQV